MVQEPPGERGGEGVTAVRPTLHVALAQASRLASSGRVLPLAGGDLAAPGASRRAAHLDEFLEPTKVALGLPLDEPERIAR